MGTDYPFPWTHTSVDHILDTPGLSDAERSGDAGRYRGAALGNQVVAVRGSRMRPRAG